MVEYSKQELERFASNDAILPQLLDAKKRGDAARAAELRSQIIYPAEALLAVKETRGADWIRARNLRTDDADRKYGADWLDRDVVS